MTAREQVLDYFEERFGIARKHFDGFEFYLASKGRVFLGPKRIPPVGEPVSVGILVARLSKEVKPTTNLLQLFGRHATKSIIGLSEKHALEYMKGSDIRFQDENSDPGYVILAYCGVPLGCGHLKDGMIKNMLPKAKRIDVSFA